MNRAAQYLLSSLVLILFCTHSHAANPSDWWVHITNDRAAQVERMIREGADVNAISPGGQPSIMHAIREGAWDVYEVLLNHPDTVFNAINTHRETPLMYLAVIGETERARDLIKRGALVNRRGWTPLHYAASTGQLETVQMLLDHDAEVNAPAPDGTTPLMMAAYAGSEPVVRLLLAAGADLALRTNQDYDVVDWANFKSHTNLAGKLRDLIAGMNAPSQGSALDGMQAGTTPENAVPQEELSASSAKPSSSRYFDLDRFNDPESMSTP